MKVFLSAEAEADLEAVADYIARDNPRRAATFVAELAEHCMGIGAMPEAYPPVPRYEPFGVRRRVFGNYLIFYRIEDDRVVVLHVLHGAMNYADVLFPE